MAKQTPEQEALDQQRVYDNAMAVQQMKARRQAEAYRDIQRETEASQGRYQANPILQQYLESNPDVFRAATDAAIQSGVPKQGSRFTGGISNEYQNILDDFARQHYMEFGRKEGRGIASLPTVGRGELDRSIRDFTPREYTTQNYGYVPNSFDAEYYAASNPDVRQALGASPFDLYQHFIDYGKAEGRQARNPLGPQQFAEGGQVMGGMQPMTPASENSGIASGMMPEPPPPEGMQMMQQMAGQMEQVYSGLDNAENIEDVINAMRGDDLPLSERYSELAELVGPADAKKTPESVLTVLQPVFQTLEAVPDGGIAEAPMGGVEGSEGNFSQPSATEPSDQAEAVLAMSRGEMPVGMFLGGELNIGARRGAFPSINSMNNAQTVMGGNVPQPNNKAGLLPYMPSQLAPPVYEPINVDALRKNMNLYQDLQKDISLRKGETDPAVALANRQEILSQFAPKAETAEELLARRKEFMGDTGADSSEIQGYLALAQAGSELASSPGSLLQGLTKAAGPLAANLSKIASAKTEREFKAKGAAFDSSLEQEEKLRQFNASLAVSAIDETTANEKDFRKTENDITTQLASKGISEAIADKTLKDKAVTINYTQQLANKATLGRYSEVYGRVNPKTGKTETIMFYPGADPFYMDIDKGFVKGVPPKDWTKVKKGDVDDLLSTGKLSGLQKQMVDKGKRIYAMVRNPNYDPNGDSAPFVSVEALNVGLQTYVDLGEGRFKALDPGTFFTVKDPKTQVETDKSGVINFKDSQGKIIKVFNPVVGKLDIMGAATGKNGPAFSGQITAENQEALSKKYGTDLSGSIGQKMVLGNPNTTQIDRPALGFDIQMIPDGKGKGGYVEGGYILTADQKADQQQTLKATGELLANLKELNNSGFFETFGISGGTQQFLSENVAGLMPEAIASMLRSPQGAEARQMREQLARNIKQALALSKRYPVTEMEQLNGLVDDAGGFTTDPVIVMKKLQTFYHAVQRDYLNAAHVLDRKNNPYVTVRSQPMGNKGDPLDATATIKTKEGESISPDLITAFRIASSGRPLKGLFMKMSRSQARALGLPPKVWETKEGNYDSLITVKLKTIRNQEGNTSIGADTSVKTLSEARKGGN
jgi:hypothetical protein